MTSFLRVLMTTEALTFLVVAGLHLGIPLFGLDEPRIGPAALVEALCGTFLATGAWWYSRVSWGRSVALSAQCTSSNTSTVTPSASWRTFSSAGKSRSGAASWSSSRLLARA